MTEKDLEIIEDDGVIALVPYWSREWIEPLKYMFNNVITLPMIYDDTYIKKFNETINRKKIKNLIFVDYDMSYNDIIPFISPKTSIKFIFTHSLASFTDEDVINMFKYILDFYDRDFVETIGVFDRALYLSFKNTAYPVCYLIPDVARTNCNSYSDAHLAILSKDNNYFHSFYNILSSIKFVQYKDVKVGNMIDSTKEFIQKFEINALEVSDFDELISNNEINLYVNFTETISWYVLRSMDMGIPCLLGNVDLFDDYNCLKDNLVVESDDNISGIASKIADIRKNRSSILAEYDKFRNDYVKKALKSLDDFLNCKVK